MSEMNIGDIGQMFLNHEPIPNVAFEHNDYVEIVAGEHRGKFGSLVTVGAMHPEVVYVVELESGHDAYIPQAAIRRADI